ncbi:MAG: hypothetical protein ABSF60_07925 [Verrucomicrobiota bacterium]
MTTNSSKITTLSLFAAVLVVMPAWSRAEGTGTNAPAASGQTPVKPTKHGSLSFHGNLGAVDLKAMTLAVGTLTLRVAPDTTIIRDGKSATLADGVVGEPVSGTYKKTGDGKLTAISIHFRAKAENKRPEASGPGGAN